MDTRNATVLRQCCGGIVADNLQVVYIPANTVDDILWNFARSLALVIGNALHELLHLFLLTENRAGGYVV